MQINKFFFPNVTGVVISCQPQCHSPEAVKVTQSISSESHLPCFLQAPWEFMIHIPKAVPSGPLGICINEEIFSRQSCLFIGVRRVQSVLSGFLISHN